MNFTNKAQILDDYEQYIIERTHHHMGYPYNLDFKYEELSKFFKYSINNLGDPFQPSNYGVHSRQFELEILKFFADLWKLDDYWGYVTNSGTEGNLQSMLIARENLPNGILYTSSETHYSIFEAAHMYKMKAITIPTKWNGCIMLDILKEEILNNIDKPVIINVNVGTTMKGAIDNLSGILNILHDLQIPRDKFYVHCDGALFAMMLPYLQSANGTIVDFTLPIDSIAVSGHKFLGCPMPCGVMLTRKILMNPLLKPIEYLNSVDSTITGSRNGLSSLFLWNVITDKGHDGFRKDVEMVMENAKYLEKELTNRSISTFRNNLSSTVIFERPDEDFVIKWQLACVGDIAHVVIMPSINKEKIDLFLTDIDNVQFNKKCVRLHMGNFCQCNDCIIL